MIRGLLYFLLLKGFLLNIKTEFLMEHVVVEKNKHKVKRKQE